MFKAWLNVARVDADANKLLRTSAVTLNFVKSTVGFLVRVLTVAIVP